MSGRECDCCTAWRQLLKQELAGIMQPFFVKPISRISDNAWSVEIDKTLTHTEIFAPFQSRPATKVPYFAKIQNKGHEDFEWYFFEELKNVNGMPKDIILVALVAFAYGGSSLFDIWKKSWLIMHDTIETENVLNGIMCRIPTEMPVFEGLVNVHLDISYAGLFSCLGGTMARKILHHAREASEEISTLQLVQQTSEGFHSNQILNFIIDAKMYVEATRYMRSEQFDRFCDDKWILMRDIALQMSTDEEACKFFDRGDSSKCAEFILSCKYICTELHQEIQTIESPTVAWGFNRLLRAYMKCRSHG